jgi:Xaa-Pro dipeptidase
VVSLGSMALDDGTRVDFDQLRRERRARVLTAMEEHDLDVLLVGREANARYITGARRLWQAGSKSFTPGCVLLRATNEVYLLSNADDGIPAEIPRDHLFGRSWNPKTLVDTLLRFGGLAQSHRIGVDALTPSWRQLLAEAVPQAAFVDAQALMREVRMHKTADEIVCVRIAVAVAEAAIAAASAAVKPGATERELLAVFLERMTDFGITTPATEGPFVTMSPDPGASAPLPRRLANDRVLASGDLVALRGGVLYAGYEGSLGRTWPCCAPGRSDLSEQRELYRRWDAVWSRLREVCHPGATGADLREAYGGTGEQLPKFPIAYSVGIGVESPIAGSALGSSFDAQWRLDPGMVLGIEAFAGSGSYGYLGLETVLITPTGHEVLSTLGHGPLARES